MILATDIAEASVTIPDVTLVIDGGLHRLASLAPSRPNPRPAPFALLPSPQPSP